MKAQAVANASFSIVRTDHFGADLGLPPSDALPCAAAALVNRVAALREVEWGIHVRRPGRSQGSLFADGDTEEEPVG
jgi:hypothetical protein